MLKRLTLALAVVALSLTCLSARGETTRITGTITAIEGDHIQLKDEAGKAVILMLQKTTKYLRSEKLSTKSELKAGRRVKIEAEMDSKMKMYAVVEIEIVDAPPPGGGNAK